MSTDESCIALHLKAPLQSWGTSSQFGERETQRFPSRSAVSGMICAACGCGRGSEAEHLLLGQLKQTKFLVVSTHVSGSDAASPGRLRDFHTVQGTPIAGGGIKECHITRRNYLTDSEFYVFLTGKNELVQKIANAVRNPVWGIWLGRKSCIPSVPVFAGIFDSEDQAFSKFCCLPKDRYSFCEEVSYSLADDSTRDVPVSFESKKRVFESRNVHVNVGR